VNWILLVVIDPYDELARSLFNVCWKRKERQNG